MSDLMKTSNLSAGIAVTEADECAGAGTFPMCPLRALQARSCFLSNPRNGILSTGLNSNLEPQPELQERKRRLTRYKR
jgi:hypothetical protein